MRERRRSSLHYCMCVLISFVKNKIKNRWVCASDGGGKSVCSTVCGDGWKRGMEECDDGNTVSGELSLNRVLIVP